MNIFRKIAGALSGIALLALLPLQVASAAAGTGTASLSFGPASGSYTVGSQFSVTIRETSSEPVASVEADFSFDSSKLQCVSIAGGSAFPNTFQNTCGGSVSIVRGVQGTPVTGSQVVATVTFKALAAGTVSLVMAGSSEIDNTSVANICNATCAGGYVAATYSINAPVVTPAPTPTTPTPTPATGGNAKPAATTAPTSGSSTKTTTTTQQSPGSSAAQTTPGQTLGADSGQAQASTGSSQKSPAKNNQSTNKVKKNSHIFLFAGGIIAVAAVTAAGAFVYMRRS